MKNSIILFSMLVASLVCTTGFGQTNTLFNSGDAGYTGFYGGPMVLVHHIDGIGRTTLGGELGVGFSNFLLGGYVNFSITEFDTDIGEGEIGLGHAGLVLAYTSNQNKAIHFLGKIRLGLGDSNIGGGDIFGLEDMDDVFVATPEIGLELNLFPFVKMGLLLSYQHVLDMDDVPGFESSNYSGLGGGISLRFGSFTQSFDEVDEEMEVKKKRRRRN